MSRIIFFTVFFAIYFGIQFLVFRTFRKFIKSKYPESVFLKVISIFPFILFNLPFIYIIFKRLSPEDMPGWLYNLIFIPFFIFQGAVVFIGLYLLVLKILKSPFSISLWILNKFEKTKQFLANIYSKPPVRKLDNSRRAFLKTSTAFVSGYAFIGSTIGVLDSNNFDLVNKEIKINNLPEEIKGTTITLVSDIHSGPYMSEELMNEYVAAINNLNSDLIMIPGDLTNSRTMEVHPFVDAFKNLKAPKGIYASLGNHDYFANAEYVAEIVRKESPIKLLRNETDIININGKNLCVLGIEDTRQSGAVEDPVLMGYLNSTIEKSKAKLNEMKLDYNEVPKLALIHKPYFLDIITDKNLDLILSGHTHGGQVVLGKFGNVNISFAGLMSKYISGFYESGNTKMYVSRGIGSVALPIRFNCPPEITKITLV